MTWADILEALHVWVSTASGVTTIFARQRPTGATPTPPYITIRASTRRVGQDWLDVEDADVPTAGAEIVHRARGVRELTVTLQAFGATSTGAAAPEALLELCTSKAALPIASDALNDAGIGLASFGPVQPLEIVRNGGVLEPRAVMEVRGYVASEVSETGTYIETVETDGTVS